MAAKKSEEERQQENITNALAEREIEYLKATVINLEAKQLAESCVRVYSRRQMNRKKRGMFPTFPTFKIRIDSEYKVIFDESIRIPPLWVNEITLQFLNQNREEVKKKTSTKLKNIKKSYPQQKTTKRESEGEFGFCHQCKQRKSLIILAKCNYNSAAMGHAVPSYMIVKGVKAFNVEAYNTQAINYAIKSQMPDSRRKKETDASINNENFEYHECNRMYCSFCLKFHYDQALADCKKGWICPFCQGICHCTRCSRQDQLVKMRALLFAEGGTLDHLFDSDNKIYQIIAENWVRSEKLMYKLNEENIRPPSPIKLVKKVANAARDATSSALNSGPYQRSTHLHLTCDSTVESVGDNKYLCSNELLKNGPIVTAQEIKDLMLKREDLTQLVEELKQKKQDVKDKSNERMGLCKLVLLAVFVIAFLNDLINLVSFSLIKPSLT